MHGEDNNFSPIDPEGPDESDMDLDIDDDTEPCPHCGRVIHEQSEFCPHCGQYISLEDVPIRKAWWIVLAVAACLFIVILWLIQR